MPQDIDVRSFRLDPQIADVSTEGEAAPSASVVLPTRVPVWDLAIRAFHWLLVVGVICAWFTGGTGSRFHELAGFAVASLLLFRIMWGFTGTTYARFGEFVHSPRTLSHYLVDIARNRAGRHIGHNPAGAYMIVALLVCLAVISMTGVMQMTSRFFGVAWVEVAHHYAAIALISLVPLHLLGVLLSSWMHQENLIGAMVSGTKIAAPSPDMSGAAPTGATAHEHIMMRLHANQGFSALLFLLACGLFVGWTSTSNRIATPVVEPSAIPSVTAMQVAAAPVLQRLNSQQFKEPQDYVVSGPEDASDAWLIASGGRLYDNWFASLGKKGPTENHPSWPAANTTVSGDGTWRCKSCHGWDYMGREGRYRSGSNATGIIGVQRMKGRDPGAIMAILGDRTHAFTDDLLPQHARFRLAMFISQGQHAAAQIVPLDNIVKGDPVKGRSVFQNVCAACHGFDGRARKLGASSDKADAGYKGDALFVGTKAVSGPTELLHKIRNGHPGAIMVSMRPFPMEVAANLLAYAQTLPTK
jgi:cytochrome b/mono/diheme cytochrome c family protein